MQYRTSWVVALFAWSCLGACSAPGADDELIIGIATAQTGALASYDQPALAGFRMAVDEINARGGFGGRFPARLIVRDTRSDLATGATIALELVDAGAHVVVTPCDADPSIVVGQITQGRDIPTLTFCGSSPILPAAVGDMMFSTYPTDNLQAAALAHHANSSGHESAYLLVSPDTAYTARLPEYFASAFEALGGTVVGRGSFTMGQSDFSTIATRISHLSMPPDVIVTAAYEPDFPAFIRQLRSAGVTAPVFGADALGTPTISGLGALVDGLVFTSAGCAEPGSRLHAFRERFEKATGHPPRSSYEASGYEVAQIIDAAVDAADSLSGRAIRDAIAALEDVPLLSGTVTYAGSDRIPIRPVALQRYQGGDVHCIAEVTPPAEAIPQP